MRFQAADNYLDIISAGNLLHSEIETPRNDAGIGQVIQTSNDGFTLIDSNQSKLFLNGEVKDIATIRLGKEKKVGILVAVNNDELKLMTLTNQ